MYSCVLLLTKKYNININHQIETNFFIIKFMKLSYILDTRLKEIKI